MISPEDRNDCTNCNGTGNIGSKCPYPWYIEPDCRECSIPCNENVECPICDGKGWLSPNEERAILEEDKCDR